MTKTAAKAQAARETRTLPTGGGKVRIETWDATCCGWWSDGVSHAPRAARARVAAWKRERAAELVAT
jgi:hypothetical protein